MNKQDRAKIEEHLMDAAKTHRDASTQWARDKAWVVFAALAALALDMDIDTSAASIVAWEKPAPEAAPMPIEDAEPDIEKLADAWKHTGIGLLMERAKRLSGYMGRAWLFDGKLRRGRGNGWYLDANGTSYYFQNKSRAARFFAEFVVRGTVNTANLRMR